MKENMKIALGILFPELETAFVSGYTADEHGYIWSTRQGTERKLSLQSVGSKSYTCINKPAGYRFGKAITATYAIKRSDIIDRLAKHNLSQAKSYFHVELTATGYIVGSVTLSGLTFAPYAKIHKSLADVRTETERLAKLNPGKTFVYLEIRGNCTAGGVKWS
jgi:hypothetical protein